MAGTFVIDDRRCPPMVDRGSSPPDGTFKDLWQLC